MNLGWPLAQGSLRSKRADGTGAAGIYIGVAAAGVDFTVTPKRLLVVPLFVPGGVLSVRVALALDTPADTDIWDFKAVIGTYGQSGFDYTNHPSPAQVALSSPGNFNPVTICSGRISLAELGDPTEDREFELIIYQANNCEFITNHLSSYLVTAETFTRGRRVTQDDHPQAVVQPGDVLGGALTPELISRIKAEENQRAISLLGRVPGLAPDLSPDLSRGYIQQILYPHQHQGVLVPDGFGELFSDGKIVRRGHGSAFVCTVDEAVDKSVPSTPAGGILIHPDGNLGASWGSFLKKVPIAAGCPFLDFRFAISPATEQRYTRLTILIGVFADFADSDDDGLTTEEFTTLFADRLPLVSLSSGQYDRAVLSADPGLNLLIIQCDPVDHPGWVPNREIRGEAGKWTRYALKTASETPEGFVRESAYRVTELITANLTHPGLRVNDVAHKTQDYNVVVRPMLETLDTPGTYDTGARLLWWQVNPRDMEP